jgi:hypothetical protein
MAANDWRTGDYAIDPQGRGNFDKQKEDLKGQEFTMVRYFDCVANPLTNADTYKVMTIDAGVLVTGAWIMVETAEGAADTLDIGDSGSATAYHDDLSVNSTGVAALTTQAKYYAAADYIDVLANAGIAAAKFYLIFRCVRLV